MDGTIFSLLGKKRKKHMLLLLPAMLFGSVLETLGIGMIVSVCALLVNDRLLYEDRTVLWVCGLMHIQLGRDLIRAVLIALMVLYLFKFFYLAWENYIVAKFVRTTRREMSVKLFRNILRAPYPFFVQHSTAELNNLLGRDADQLAAGLDGYMRLFLEGFIALALVVFLLLIEPRMTVFVAGGIMFLLLLTRLVLDRIIERASVRQRTAGRRRWKWLHEAVTGIKTVRIGGHEGFFSRHFEQAEEEFARSEYLRQFWTRLPILCIETVVVLSILFYLLFLSLSGEELSRFLPSLSALALAAVRLLPTFNRINASLNQIGYAKASLDALRRAMEQTASVAGKDRPQITVPFTQGIALHGVTYAYKDGVGDVLENVDMDIPAGAAVGIVGPSGAGKTTLLDILLGLLTPDQGDVLVDGVPLNECRDSYWQRVAYVPQETFLLDDTIRGNVAMGVEPEQIDDARVWAALEQVALDQMVRELPEGLDERVGEQGVRLSGGERQRLGLAQAMYRDPSVIVFDEATSALDLDTEAAVLQSILQLRSTKTLIIVSHRLSAIEHCDRVYRVRDRMVLREK